jgi:hypothetical protein
MSGGALGLAENDVEYFGKHYLYAAGPFGIIASIIQIKTRTASPEAGHANGAADPWP